MDNTEHHGDFLTMQVELELNYLVSAPAGGSSENNWASHRVIEKLPSFYHDDDDCDDDYEDDYEDYYDEMGSDEDEVPRTPSPAERHVVGFKNERNVHEITPEQQATPQFILPDLVELQIKCQRTLQKLASSMRRSDETRSIVKRQRLQSPGFNEDLSDNYLFAPQRASTIEESRRKLYQMINMRVSSTVDTRF